MDGKSSYQDVNAKTVNRWVDEGWEWGRPVDHEAFVRARDGNPQIRLTPTKAMPTSWWPELVGMRVLGLASGGGQQMPLLAAAGARCTVLDYSEAQLKSEREVARREGYEIDVVHADMTPKFPESYDVVGNP